jgi:hypothetical protein
MAAGIFRFCIIFRRSSNAFLQAVFMAALFESIGDHFEQKKIQKSSLINIYTYQTFMIHCIGNEIKFFNCSAYDYFKISESVQLQFVFHS